MHITVMLEYFYPWTNSAGIYLARQKGWYEAAGLDVECRTYDPMRGDSLSYLINNEADFALVPTNRLLVRHEQGAPIVGVAAINHRGMEVIQTIKQTGIIRPRDLSGRRIALNPTPRGLAMVRHLIEKDGGNPRDFTIVDSGVREFTPEDIAAGKADATFGSYWAWEALLKSSIPDNERVIWPVDTIGAPPYHSYLLSTRRQFIEQESHTIRQFLEITGRGYLEVTRNLKTVLAIYEHILPYFPESLIQKSLPLIAETWTHKGQWGLQREELMAPYAEWLYKHGILSKPSWVDAIDNRFLPTTPRGYHAPIIA